MAKESQGKSGSHMAPKVQRWGTFRNATFVKMLAWNYCLSPSLSLPLPFSFFSFQPGLKLPTQPRITLDFWTACLHLWSAGIISMQPTPGLTWRHPYWQLSCRTAYLGHARQTPQINWELLELYWRTEEKRQLTHPTVALCYQVQGCGDILCVKEPHPTLPPCPWDPCVLGKGWQLNCVCCAASPHYRCLTQQCQQRAASDYPTCHGHPEKRGPELCCVWHLYNSYI